MKASHLAAWFLLVQHCAIASQTFPQYSPPRLEVGQLPVIDGLLDDPVWSTTERITDFHQIRPVDGGQPSERTEVQFAYSANMLYVAVRAHDSDVASLGAKGLLQGQDFFSDDRFEVRFDTFNDRRNAYFFQVNPNGIRREALLGNDYFINDWDTVWFAQAKVHDWGWSAEMAIPTKSLAFDPTGDTWGLNFSRVYPRRGEEMSWSSRNRSLIPAVSGFANGLSGLEQGRGIELIPSLSAIHQTLDNDANSFELEPSLTAFYNITPYLTGGLTFNTDFSATEVDERQINLTRFSLFFPEKRDFFLRDASIFEFGSLDDNGRPFFSRRIGLSADGTPLDIRAGGKISGRAGPWNVGGLVIQQDRGTAGADEALFVGRATRNVLSESEVGFIATHGDPNSTRGNSLLGADFAYRRSDFLGDRRLRGNLWLQQSDTGELSGRQRAYGGRISYPNDRYAGFLDWRRIEQNFNPALGFVNRSGVDQIEAMIRHRHRFDSGFWQWIGARLRFSRSDRIDGGLQSESWFINPIQGVTSGNDFFTVFYGRETEGLLTSFDIFPGIEVPAGRYPSDRYGVFMETGPQRTLSAVLEVVDGDFLGGSNLLIAPELQWRPSRHFFAGIGWTENKIELPAGDFDIRLLRARANIAFNSKLAWLNLVQTDNLSDTISFNSRLRYEPAPGREYFLVVDHSRDRNDERTLGTTISAKVTFNFRL